MTRLAKILYPPIMAEALMSGLLAVACWGSIALADTNPNSSLGPYVVPACSNFDCTGGTSCGSASCGRVDCDICTEIEEEPGFPQCVCGLS